MPSPRITAASRRSGGSTPRRDSRPARSRRWWPRRRSSSGSTSAPSIWCARLARLAASRRCCSEWAARATPFPGRRKAACSRRPATISIECAALVRAVRRGELDRIVSHDAPLDVLSQQLVAETACVEYTEDALFELTQPCLALSRAREVRFRCGRDDGGRRHRQPTRAPQRDDPSRRSARHGAGPQGIAHAGDCLGRRHS